MILIKTFIPLLSVKMCAPSQIGAPGGKPQPKNLSATAFHFPSVHPDQRCGELSIRYPPLMNAPTTSLKGIAVGMIAAAYSVQKIKET